MGEKKLKISDVSQHTSINRGTITRLYHETYSRIEVDVIDTLCHFFDCRVEDLFEFLPEKSISKNESNSH
jgi:putative transcriptional regulator